MKIHYGWEKIKEDTRQLARQLDPQSFDTIVAITRGGLFVAGLLSYFLDKRFIHTYGLKTYEGQHAHTTQELFKPPIVLNERVLVVDDLVDRGMTMSFIGRHHPDVQKAVLYVSETQISLVDKYVQIKPEQWIIFPWDPQEEA